MLAASHAPAFADNEVDPESIALCLSGGGLRATLFHLGLLRALRRTQLNGRMALAAVREVYAVSGGSILAGHLLANYPRYIDEDDSVFEKVEQEILAFADRDLRNRVLRRWPLRFMAQNPRGHLLQAEYHRLFSKRTIGECYAGSEVRPTFHFLATSFTNGALCSFSRTLFEQIDRNAGDSTASTSADGIPLAFAVAASSAFPPMFPPMRLTPEVLGTDGAPPFNTPIALSDGGVFDNFGIDKFCLAQRTDARPGILIVSNAGGSFATDPGHDYDGMLSRNIRASDILMRRVGDTTLETGRALAKDNFILVRIGETVPDPSIAETTQQRFRLIRTDLDRFNRGVAALLVEHGERVARHALGQHGHQNGGPATFALAPQHGTAPVSTAPSNDRTMVLDRELSAAAKRSWTGLAFDVRDFFLVGLWWIVGIAVLIVMMLSAYTGWDYFERRRELAQLLESRTVAMKLSQAKLEAIRKAAVAGDMAEVRQTLALAIETSRDLVKQPDSVAPEVPNRVAPAAVTTILQAPVVRTLRQVSFPQKVFIQFAGDLRRGDVATLNQQLRQAGWAVQGTSGERTTSAAGTALVKHAARNIGAGRALADAINQSGVPVRRVAAREAEGVGDNLEVWMSR